MVGHLAPIVLQGNKENLASRASAHLFIQREEPLHYLDLFVQNTL